MARIRNTEYPAVRTKTLYDEETMEGEYDPPGIVFDEDGGAVANVKSAVADAVVEKFDNLEHDDAADADTDADTDADEQTE